MEGWTILVTVIICISGTDATWTPIVYESAEPLIHVELEDLPGFDSLHGLRFSMDDEEYGQALARLQKEKPESGRKYEGSFSVCQIKYVDENGITLNIKVNAVICRYKGDNGPEVFFAKKQGPGDYIAFVKAAANA